MKHETPTFYGDIFQRLSQIEEFLKKLCEELNVNDSELCELIEKLKSSIPASQSIVR